MPWTCEACGGEVLEDDLACPSCQAAKSSWTMNEERTRTFRVSGRRVVYLRGIDADSRAPDDPAWATPTLVPAEEALVLPRAEARAAAERGHRPPSRHVLVARLFPKKQTDWTVGVEVEFDAREVAEHEVPAPDDAELHAEGHYDALLTFVVGEDDGPLELPGVTAIDVTEAETILGHAPAVALRALRKPPHKLPLRGVGGAVVPRFVIAGTQEPTPVRNCFLRVEPVEEGAAPARTFWVGAEGRPDPEPEGELVEGARYRLHWEYGEIEDPAAIPAGEWQEVTGAAEVAIRPRRGKGKLHLRLLAAVRSAPHERPAHDDDAEVPAGEQDGFERAPGPAAGGADEGPAAHDAPPVEARAVVEAAGEDLPLGEVHYALSRGEERYEGRTDAEGYLLHEPVPLGPYLLEVGALRLIVNALHTDNTALGVLVGPLAQEGQPGAAAEEQPAAAAPARGGAVALASIEAWNPRRDDDPLAEYRRKAAEAFA